ncbi:MAG: hypothetical protein M3514_15895 [Actinomycetota bacterium]|nr:hypothetical protein [Actinomycetota bacterium]
MANNNRGYVPEEERCKGISRQSKEPCKRRRSPGSEYCIFHGGRVPKGGAHPNFKDGRRSRYMPSELFEHFERFVNDPKITHHRESLATIDVLIQEAWDDYEDGGTPELWRALRTAWRRVEKARAKGDSARLGGQLDQVGHLIERGAEQIDRHERILKLLEGRRKHAVAETKRRLAEERTYTHEEATAFYAGLGEAVRKHISDPKMLNAIFNDIAAIAGRADIDIPLAPEAE